MAFTSISLAPDLTPAQRRRAVVAGPPAVAGDDAAALGARTGFVDVQARDVTGDYHATSLAWRAARLRHRDALRPLDPATFDDRVERGRKEAEALEAGLIRRTLYVATRPRVA